MNQAAQKLNLFDDEPGLFEQQPLPKPVATVAKPAAVAKPVAPAPVQRAKVEKSPTAHRTISEVAEDLDVPQHVLRFWETKFAQLRPLKRAGGRRYYRTEDITLIRHIHSLLYAQGYTIKGAQKVLKEKQPPAIAPAVTVVDKPVEVSAKPAPKTDPYKELREMLIELKALRALV